MLNRSILRSRVFHRLFGMRITLSALKEAAKDDIFEDLRFDLETGEKIENEDYKALCDKANTLFDEYLDKSPVERDELDNVSAKVVSEVDRYRSDAQQVQSRTRKELIKGTEDLKSLYYAMLDLIYFLDIQAKVELQKLGEVLKGDGANKSFLNQFRRNKVLRLLVDTYENPERSKLINWKMEEDALNTLLFQGIKKHEAYQKYAHVAEPTFDEDREILLQLISEVFFENKVVNDLLEEKCISWFQDKAIVRSMVRRTFKALDEKAEKLPDYLLAVNWEDDKVFFHDLYDYSLKNWVEYGKIMEKQAKNWDPERIAQADKALIIIAIAEMIHFASIPVKVTINEYIELSKKYSTPNSKTFINGVLDKISEGLIKEGKIRKSGRGLIDNK